MSYRSDLTVFSPEGELAAIVQIMNVQGLDREEAIGARGNLVRDYGLPGAPFFVLISQDRGFLWTDALQLDPDAPPTLEFPMEPVIRRYFHDVDDAARLHRSTLELITFRWLLDLTASGASLNGQEPSLPMSAFLGAVKGGKVDMEALV